MKAKTKEFLYTTGNKCRCQEVKKSSAKKYISNKWIVLN